MKASWGMDRPVSFTGHSKAHGVASLSWLSCLARVQVQTPHVQHLPSVQECFGFSSLRLEGSPADEVWVSWDAGTAGGSRGHLAIQGRAVCPSHVLPTSTPALCLSCILPGHKGAVQAHIQPSQTTQPAYRVGGLSLPCLKSGRAPQFPRPGYPVGWLIKKAIYVGWFFQVNGETVPPS